MSDKTVRVPAATTAGMGRRIGSSLPAAVGLFLLFLLTLVPVDQGWADSGRFEAALSQLSERSFKVKAEAVDAIARSGDERALQVLAALLGGELYYRKPDKQIVFAQKLAVSWQ